MKRVLILSAVAVAALAASTAPAVAGLMGNASFSHQLPVRVPSGAQPAELGDDNGHDGTAATDVDTGAEHHRGSPSESRATSAGSSDNRRGPRSSEPGDDRGVDPTDTDTGDDRGVDPTDTDTGDEHHGGRPGASATATSTPSSGDDHGGHQPDPTGTDDHGHDG